MEEGRQLAANERVIVADIGPGKFLGRLEKTVSYTVNIYANYRKRVLFSLFFLESNKFRLSAKVPFILA